MAWRWHAADGGGWPPRTAGRRLHMGAQKEGEGCLKGVSTLCWQGAKQTGGNSERGAEEGLTKKKTGRPA